MRAGEERQLAEKDQQLAEKDRQLSEKDRQLAEKDQRIQDLMESLSWKVTAPLRKGYELLRGVSTQGEPNRGEATGFSLKKTVNVLRNYQFRQAIPNIRQYGLRTFLQNASREFFGGRTEDYFPEPPLQGSERYEIYYGTVDVNRPLTFPEVSEPLVSIIIPVHNKWDYTYSCLYSILENSKDIPYEVIVADDVSTDETKDIGKYISGIRVIRNEMNLRFLKNCNNAAKQARGKYVLFLNNDTNVQKEWLKSLVELMEKDETIGMVGSKLVFPDGRLQEAGGIVWSDGSAMNYGRLDDPDKPEYNYVKEADYVSGACMMIRQGPVEGDWRL